MQTLANETMFVDAFEVAAVLPGIAFYVGSAHDEINNSFKALYPKVRLDKIKSQVVLKNGLIIHTHYDVGFLVEMFDKVRNQ